jgi:hypothetical protein
MKRRVTPWRLDDHAAATDAQSCSDQQLLQETGQLLVYGQQLISTLWRVQCRLAQIVFTLHERHPKDFWDVWVQRLQGIGSRQKLATYIHLAELYNAFPRFAKLNPIALEKADVTRLRTLAKYVRRYLDIQSALPPEQRSTVAGQWLNDTESRARLPNDSAHSEQIIAKLHSYVRRGHVAMQVGLGSQELTQASIDKVLKWLADHTDVSSAAATHELIDAGASCSTLVSRCALRWPRMAVVSIERFTPLVSIAQDRVGDLRRHFQDPTLLINLVIVSSDIESEAAKALLTHGTVLFCLDKVYLPSTLTAMATVLNDETSAWTYFISCGNKTKWEHMGCKTLQEVEGCPPLKVHTAGDEHTLHLYKRKFVWETVDGVRNRK